MKHDWRRDLCEGVPVLRCTRRFCHVVWWPDRSEPKRACKGEL